MYDLTLHRLKVFTDVVDTGGIGAAAIEEGVSQPTISAHVKALEILLRQPLFERRPGRSSELTEAGKIFYRYAKNVVLASEKVSDVFYNMANGHQGHISIGAVRSIANFIMPLALVNYSCQWPTIRVSVHTGDVRKLLISGTVNLGVIGSRELPEYFNARRIGEQPILLVSAPSNPLADRETVSVAEIRNEKFVTSHGSSIQHRLFDSLLQAIDLYKRQVVIEMDDATSIKNVVRQGLGIAVVMESTAHDELERGDLVALNLQPPLPSLGLWVINRPKHEFSSAEQNFVDVLEASVTSQVATAPTPCENCD